MTVQAVKPPTHLHPCPSCRSLYNIAPINIKTVPPNLRSLVTPHIRKVYLDVGEDEGSAGPSSPTSPVFSTPDYSWGPAPAPLSADPTPNERVVAELARLRAENQTLRQHTASWRKRAELHGKAHLHMLNFAKAIRDQAATIARERNELQKQCASLKRRLDEEPDGTPSSSRLWSLSTASGSGKIVNPSHHMDSPAPGSLLFAPLHPFSATQQPPRRVHTNQVPAHTRMEQAESPFSDSGRPRKKSRHDLSEVGAKLHSVRNADAVLSPLPITGVPEEI